MYVAKLSRNTRESELKDGFSKFGPIRNIVLKSTFAFIYFETPEQAQEAIKRMNGVKFVNGEELVVEPSGTLLMTFVVRSGLHGNTFSSRDKKKVQWTAER